MWLERQLTNSPAQIHVIGSGSQVIAREHFFEKWGDYPKSRQRLFDLLAKTKPARPIILSGDRHMADLSVADAGIGYPLYDLTASGLTQASQEYRDPEPNRHRVATMSWGNHFGVVEIDWTKPDPLIRLQIRDEAGEMAFQHKIPLSVLQPGSLKPKIVEVAKLASGELLTPAEWPKHVNKKVTVEMTVHSTGGTAALVFLNSCAEFSAEENFTVALDKKAQDQLKAMGVDAPKAHFLGKAIRVTGTLTVYRERPEIIVSDAGQIEVSKS